MNVAAPNTGIRTNIARNIGSNVKPNVVSESSFLPSMPSYTWILVAVIAVMILIAVYYQTIGYYIHIGWEKLRWSHNNGEKIAVEVPGTEISAKMEPTSVGNTLTKMETDVATALGGGNEVFNISRNLYTYEEAEPLCRAFGAELATYDNIKDSYEKGADWCNYGWAKGQLALYPTQKETWEKLQHGSEDERMSCGRPGVNGGFFPNSNQRFGVNCYGRRPPESALDERTNTEQDADTSYDREVMKFKSELDSIPVNPWNKTSWSM